jgi:hypothetical protein
VEEEEHWPFRQTCPVLQTFEQPPQLLKSVCVSTQDPLQEDCPVSQDELPPGVTHWLSLQELPVGHTFPHAPQLPRSSVRSRQVPSQLVSPERQFAAEVTAAGIVVISGTWIPVSGPVVFWTNGCVLVQPAEIRRPPRIMQTMNRRSEGEIRFICHSVIKRSIKTMVLSVPDLFF